MKTLLSIISIVLLLCFSVVEAQIPSSFPRLDETKAVGVDMLQCPSGNLLAITSYIYDNETKFLAYESEDGLFAIGKFVKQEFIGVYILLPTKQVVFYSAKETANTPKVCATLDALKPNKNAF